MRPLYTDVGYNAHRDSSFNRSVISVGDVIAVFRTSYSNPHQVRQSRRSGSLHDDWEHGS